MPWPPDPLAPGPISLTHTEGRFGAVSMGNEAPVGQHVDEEVARGP